MTSEYTRLPMTPSRMATASDAQAMRSARARRADAMQTRAANT
jgi:hypothetical protein